MTLLGYIDPGTGAIIMQVIAAGVIGAGIVFRRVVLSPFRLAARLFSAKKKSDEEAAD